MSEESEAQSNGATRHDHNLATKLPPAAARAPLRVTELRIHGVSGTPPENMLDDPHPVRFSGDELGSFYRARTPPKDRDLEAYSWAGFSSGNSSRAFWVILLPFALVNTAAWMRPPLRNHRKSFVQQVVRLLAIAQTIAFTYLLSAVLLDVVAYQCGHLATCTDQGWWFFPLNHEWMHEQPGRRIATGAVAVLLILGLMCWRLRKGWQDYETFPPFKDEEERAGVLEAGADYLHPALGDRTFWDGASVVERLQAIHLSAALAALAVAIGVSMREISKPRAEDSLGWTVFLVVGCAALLVCAVLVCLPCVHSRSPWNGNRQARFVWGIQILALGMVMYGLVVAFHDPASSLGEGKLPGFGAAVLGVLSAQVLLLIILACGLGWKNLCKRKFLGFGPFFAAAISVFLLDAIWGGLVFRLAELVGSAQIAGLPSDQTPENSIVVSASYLRASVLLLWMLLLSGILALALYIWSRHKSKDKRRDVKAQYAPPHPPGRVARLARVWQMRELIPVAERALIALCFVAGAGLIVIGIIAFAGSSIGNELPQELKSGIPRALPEPWLAHLATWVVAALPVGLYLLMRAATKQPDLRRKVGVAWDIMTFWPRTYHPFSPPCYGERVIPQLYWRARDLTDEGSVLLSGHSQGSVISAALITQMDSATSSKVALMTYGSPLASLFRRLFPSYLGEDLVVTVGERLSEGWREGRPSRWQNFYRNSDPISGPIFSSASAATRAALSDTKLKDPTSLTAPIGDPPPPIQGHSHYLQDPTLDQAILTLVADLRG